jgi:hypothetical protein
MPKAGDLAAFSVKKRNAPAIIEPTSIERSQKSAPKLITKGFRVLPEAAHQFEMLRAELGKEHPKDMGPKLIAEALNLLFNKYGKPPIA